MKNTKNKQLVITRTKHGMWLIALCSFLLIFSACDQAPNGSTGDTTIISPVNRFEALPYHDNDKIKYSFTYDDYDFYYIYLGELRNIPLFFQTARYHSGIDWTYTFSITNITQDSIRRVITESTQTVKGIVDTYTVSTTHNVKASLEITEKFNIKYVDIIAKESGEYNWNNYTSSTTTSSFQKTTSLTDTIEHATSYTYSTLESDQFHLNSDNMVGYYRWTLFSTSDVYLYVIKNSKTNEIYYEFREYVIPDAYFWYLDYSETPSFRKSDVTTFELDISILENLPKPELDFISYTIEYNANGGSGTMEHDVHGYGIAQNLLRNNFIPPAGYYFAGWARSSNALDVEFSDEEPVINLTNVKNATVILYAVWTLSVVTLDRTFKENELLITVIPANITKAIIRGENGVTYNNAEIIVVNRTLPLTIELHNVNAVGRYGTDGGAASNGEVGKPVIYMGNYTRVPNLTIISSGTQNRLDGGKGGKGGQGNNNSTGKNGGNGGAAIIADRIIIMGDKNIILKGGNGGSGGRGGNLGISLNASNGGNGGNGGAAIDANNIANNLEGILFALRSAGGTGGELFRGATGLALIGGSNGSAGIQGVQFTSTPNPLGIVRDQL